jgi:hypothetical protein
MQAPARKIRFRGTVENRHEANPLLEQPGDSVTVVRGRPRSFVMACPDGCGSILTVNLDPRAGKAWRLYSRDRMSLYPSVWRDGGCGAHFVVWKDRILWCDDNADDDYSPRHDPGLESAVLARLDDRPRSANEIAEELDEIPWEVDRALKLLRRAGRAEAVGNELVQFILRPAPRGAPSPQTTPPRKSWWQRLWDR